jgi:nucleotide-binding universal stress UspA family protein
MSETIMKILLAYDGSACSESAVDDLARAGLPERGDLLVMSVAEVWLPPVNGDASETGIELDASAQRMIEEHHERDRKLVAEAERLANHAKDRIKKMLPMWTATAEATYGSPAWEVIARADSFAPDLIVVGAQGQSALSRFFLGSISQKVLTEASSSVRVARGRIEVDPAPARIIIGYDGSAGSNAAAVVVAARRWPSQSEVQLFAATENLTPSAIGRFIPPVARLVDEVNSWERAHLETQAQVPKAMLEAAGLSVSIVVKAGNPKTLLPEAAEQWNADCIFVGANRFGSRVERFVLGSTSAAVAARAQCSVEVVRVKA